MKAYGIEQLKDIEVRVPPPRPAAKTYGYSDDSGDGTFDGYAYYNSWYGSYYTDVYSYDTGSLFYFKP